jgi:hypothetical protein
MPTGVDDSGRPVTPELILDGEKDRRAHSDGSVDSLIDVRNVNEDDHRRAPVSSWCAAGRYLRERRLQHEERAIDAHGYVNGRPIRPGPSHLLDSAKRHLAEVCLSFRALADQHRKHRLHTLGHRLGRDHQSVSGTLYLSDGMARAAHPRAALTVLPYGSLRPRRMDHKLEVLRPQDHDAVIVPAVLSCLVEPGQAHLVTGEDHSARSDVSVHASLHSG